MGCVWFHSTNLFCCFSRYINQNVIQIHKNARHWEVLSPASNRDEKFGSSFGNILANNSCRYEEIAVMN